jgi:hypothetical protein
VPPRYFPSVKPGTGRQKMAVPNSPPTSRSHSGMHNDGSTVGHPRGRARGLPRRLPKLTSSQSTEQNSEHLTELKTPGNNPDDLNSARCKAVNTGSIPVVASRSTCISRVVVQAIVGVTGSAPQGSPKRRRKPSSWERSCARRSERPAIVPCARDRDPAVRATPVARRGPPPYSA